MAYTYTSEEIADMRQHLENHPIDPEYEDLFDGEVPLEQQLSLLYRATLKRLGELPEDEGK